jgi:hypothetical protein
MVRRAADIAERRKRMTRTGWVLLVAFHLSLVARAHSHTATENATSNEE